MGRALQKVELLEGKKKGKRPGSAGPTSAVSRTRPSRGSMDWIGLDEQFASLPPVTGAGARKEEGVRICRPGGILRPGEELSSRPLPGHPKEGKAKHLGSSLGAARSTAALLEGHGRRGGRRKSLDLGLQPGNNRATT